MRSRVTGVALEAAAALAAAGAALAAYLTYVHYAGRTLACTGLGDCHYVQSSDYAYVAGLPVALLGALAYATVFALVAGAWLRASGAALLAAWGVGLSALAFSAYLTWVEFAVLSAVCVYCVASAGIVAALFAALSAGLWAARDDVPGMSVAPAASEVP
jgi:uncharacterized membrane protein